MTEPVSIHQGVVPPPPVERPLADRPGVTQTMHIHTGGLRVPTEYHKDGITYSPFTDDSQMQQVQQKMDSDLSEPYSIFTYRYFVHNWPTLTWLAKDDTTGETIGAVVSKLEQQRGAYRGYIAMLAVDSKYRKRGVGTELVVRTIEEMQANGAQEVVLEALMTNKAALRLYENLGFVRDKRLNSYYLNGEDAFRLKLYLVGDEHYAYLLQQKQFELVEEQLAREQVAALVDAAAAQQPIVQQATDATTDTTAAAATTNGDAASHPTQ